ncbi:glutathione peroxidase [soil metagenome]
MKKTLLFLTVIAGIFIFISCNTSDNKSINNKSISNIKQMDKNVYGIKIKDIEGKDVDLAEYKGKVLMIVNVASKCGNTPQYESLEKLYEIYKGKGFEVLGFPCNDFGGQEPGTNEEIKTFCKDTYNVSFRLFDKVKVLGDEKSKLYNMLTAEAEPAGDVKWNFEKFIIDKNGNIVKRFGNKVDPMNEEIIKKIEEQLNS